MSLPRIVQLEVTTHCQLRCIFCPHTVLSDRWLRQHMAWEVFEAFLPWAAKVELVHLQGWGEPLLHPQLFKMAAALKARGTKVSITTNGMLLDEGAVEEICGIAVDLVAVSLSGSKATTNDSLRMGARLERITSNLSRLLERSPRPEVHLVMQTMRPNMEELPEVVRLAAELGVEEVVFPNLDYSPSPEVEALHAFDREADPHYGELLEEAQRIGKELGVGVHPYPLAPRQDVLMCDAQPVHTVWISVFGEVTACPYLCLSVKGKIPRLFWGELEEIERSSFGDLAEGLDRVWRGKRARTFREAFSRRLAFDRLGTMARADLSDLPRVSSLSVSFLETLAGMAPGEKIPPPPPVCQHCYKLYGL